jgi:tetraacyldisaccharide 4'-kinase
MMIVASQWISLRQDLHHNMRFLLFPFALIYGWAASFRNHLYDLRIWKSVAFDINVISVGNLAVGGTGKSPMVEYLVKLLKENGHKPATLSRGYKRKTRGFRLAGNNDNASTLGDEPFQFWLKFKKEIPVAVGEERVMAIPEILYEHEDRDVVVCDDAFQHRNLRPNFSILLSTFDNPFFTDYVMPVGNLREKKNGAERADVLIFTKCNENVETLKISYIQKAKKYLNAQKPIFFTKIKYQDPVRVFENEIVFNSDILLVTGLADSSQILEYVSCTYSLVKHIEYGDHHDYKEGDVDMMKDAFNTLSQQNENNISILTTEKDFVKISAIKELSTFPFFYLPIEIEFLYEGDKFERLILDSFKD